MLKAKIARLLGKIKPEEPFLAALSFVLAVFVWYYVNVHAV